MLRWSPTRGSRFGDVEIRTLFWDMSVFRCVLAMSDTLGRILGRMSEPREKGLA